MEELHEGSGSILTGQNSYSDCLETMGLQPNSSSLAVETGEFPAAAEGPAELGNGSWAWQLHEPGRGRQLIVLRARPFSYNFCSTASHFTRFYARPDIRLFGFPS